MAVDELATQGVTAEATIILSYFSQHTPITAPDGLDRYTPQSTPQNIQ